jgi:hypothetical protein
MIIVVPYLTSSRTRPFFKSARWAFKLIQSTFIGRADFPTGLGALTARET